jgi:hypothetical protein
MNGMLFRVISGGFCYKPLKRVAGITGWFMTTVLVPVRDVPGAKCVEHKRTKKKRPKSPTHKLFPTNQQNKWIEF